MFEKEAKEWSFRKKYTYEYSYTFEQVLDAYIDGVRSREKQLARAKEIILKLYNAGRDVLMCRAEEKAYDNLDEAINNRSIEQFLKEVEK